uniref:D,D-heptose 1,7-bisphosphate phosphatase n=1 Tax=Anaerolinea thermolimosa TaxID=229919 RepID=A0A7C4KK70_9CHLR
MHRGLFLDRDGVIIENRDGYVLSWEDVEIFPQALEALAMLSSAPFKIVIVTNQAAVGKGLLTLHEAREINRRLIHIIRAAGGAVDGVYLCPHTAEDHCSCRKPQPGLILQAARELEIDLSRSALIGDALTDLQAGQAAGIPQLALVRTGRGAVQEPLARANGFQNTPVFDHLKAAVTSWLFALYD